MKKIGSIMITLSIALLIGVAPCEAFDEPYTCSILFSTSPGLDECPPCSTSVGPICIQRVDWDNSRAVLPAFLAPRMALITARLLGVSC